MLTDDHPTIVLGLEDDGASATEQSTGTVPSLFGLSLATALPPAAMLAPPGVPRPRVRSGADVILAASEVSALLGQRSVEVWRGWIGLGDVDERLGGLEILLSVFQVTDGSGALVCLSVVRPDPLARGDDGATPADLWALACEALRRYAVTHQRLVGLGDDALLIAYGDVTGQVAWLAGDRLVTASVTCLSCEPGWAIDAARSIARVLDRRLKD